MPVRSVGRIQRAEAKTGQSIGCRSQRIIRISDSCYSVLGTEMPLLRHYVEVYAFSTKANHCYNQQQAVLFPSSCPRVAIKYPRKAAGTVSQQCITGESPSQRLVREAPGVQGHGWSNIICVLRCRLVKGLSTHTSVIHKWVAIRLLGSCTQYGVPASRTLTVSSPRTATGHGTGTNTSRGSARMTRAGALIIPFSQCPGVRTGLHVNKLCR